MDEDGRGAGSGVYSYNVTNNTDITLYGAYIVPEQLFSYTGGTQTWTVPGDGVYKLEVWGAHGEGAYAYDKADQRDWWERPMTASGGKGGYVSAELQLTGGDVLTISVGQGGLMLVNRSSTSWQQLFGSLPTGYTFNNYSRPAFYNSSGTGYVNSSNGFSSTTGRAGGYTRISLGGTVLVTANGGGGGHAYWNTDSGSNGSNGSGSATSSASNVVITTGGNSDMNGRAKISMVS